MRERAEEVLPKLTAHKTRMIETEFIAIAEAIAFCKGNKSEAAKFLQIDRKTLYKKILLHEIIQFTKAGQTIA